MLVAACGDDVMIDARRDATSVDGIPMQVCAVFPQDGIPSCTGDKRYCCFQDDQTTCVAAPLSASCAEHPATAPMACDPSDGSGCSGATPICCSAGEPIAGQTYCTDHALMGAIWTCSA